VPDTSDLADYEWPTCAAGPVTGAHSHQLWENELDRLVCQPCEDRTAQRLAELPGLFRKLNTTAMLMKGASRSGGGTPGTQTPPIPPRIDVLNLVGPGGIAAKLSAIEDSWRKAFNRRIAPWAGSPAEAVPVHANFLAINLRRACEEYESIGQDIDALRKLHSECQALVENKPRTGQVKIGHCPTLIEGRRCGEQLYASTRSFKTACETCGNTWEGEHEWRQLRAAQQQATAEPACVAA
jgi:hypothetical protein